MISAYQSILLVMRELFAHRIITRAELNTFIDKLDRLFSVNEKNASSYMKFGDNPQAYCGILNDLLDFKQVFVLTDKSDGFRKARVHFSTLSNKRNLILELDLNYVMESDAKIHFYENGTKILTVAELSTNNKVRETIIYLLKE